MESTELNNLEGKNWMATMMACWALGGFGAHRFYTGKTSTAFAMLVMSITGCLAPISALWAMIDGVMIALGKFRHDDGSELYERIDWVGYIYIGVVVLGIIGFAAYFALIAAGTSAALNGAHSSINP